MITDTQSLGCPATQQRPDVQVPVQKQNNAKVQDNTSPPEITNPVIMDLSENDREEHPDREFKE